jgi:two-component system cell cycle sensor histidine kinase/response regulator CckA
MTQGPHIIEKMSPGRERKPEIEPAILVVDNEPSILLLAQAILQRGGYRVLLAEGGQRALEMYRQRPFEIGLVVLDQNMPGLSGLETMNGLLAINPQVRILLMTGGHLPDFSWSLETQGWGFLPKPFQAEQLLRAVRDLLHGGGLEPGPAANWRQRPEDE